MLADRAGRRFRPLGLTAGFLLACLGLGASASLLYQMVQPTILGHNETPLLGGLLLKPGTCLTSVVSVAEAMDGMVAVACPHVYPGDGVDWSFVSAPGQVTVKVCATSVAVVPVASHYHVKVVR